MKRKSTEGGIAKLTADLSKLVVMDEFPQGTVIKFVRVSEDRKQEFTYAVVKTPAGWYTTSQRGFRYVAGILTYSELLDVLADDRVEHVAVATEWEEL